MPPLPATPSGVLKITYTTGLGAFSFMQAYSGGPPSGVDLTTLASEMATVFDDDLKSLLNSGYGLERTDVKDLATPGALLGTSGTAVVGTRAGTANPVTVCAVLDFKIPTSYRGGKPKAFLPFGSEADLTSPVFFGSAFQTDVQDAWAGLQGDAMALTVGSTSVGRQVTVSYYDGKYDNPNPLSNRRFLPTVRATPVIYTVSDVVMRLEIGSQRRRRGG